MARCPDILCITEFIPNILYFATVRPGITPQHTPETHYFSIDDELVYENYYSDFGPLNLACVYKYCKLLNYKLKQFSNKQIIVHYTSLDPKKKANAAFLLGCYGILYLGLSPREAIKYLSTQGQCYKPFQDVTLGESSYTINLLECFLAMKKARDNGLYSFRDFDSVEYERLNKIQGGDLNWIVPGKFLAFIGPVDYSVSLFHPPEMYIDYFLRNNVKVVIRLNKRMYDANTFKKVGITHIDLFYPDGSCPPRHILFKFLQISEETEGAIAVHCKAGLGRTGTLICCYLIKHYKMSAREAIAWVRICRPGSVIGHQQGWLEKLESWLLKQGNLYRKRMYGNTNRVPTHEYGIYSVLEDSRERRMNGNKSGSSTSPLIQRPIAIDVASGACPHSSKHEDDSQDEIFLASCDLTNQEETQQNMKGCIIRTKSSVDYQNNNESDRVAREVPLWKKILLCKHPRDGFDDILWKLAVSFCRLVPRRHNTNKCCDLMDRTLLRKQSTLLKQDMLKRSKPSITLTPRMTIHGRQSEAETGTTTTVQHHPVSRRLLGRSPSPPPLRRCVFQQIRSNCLYPTCDTSHIRMENQMKPSAVNIKKNTTSVDAAMRATSVGAASLGARRTAPAPPPTASARSDQRPFATQGDMLNSIKIQRRLRETILLERTKQGKQNTTITTTRVASSHRPRSPTPKAKNSNTNARN